MSASHPLPSEVGLVLNLRKKHPTRLYSELLDAFHLARTVLPDGELEDLETISSYILERTFEIRKVQANREGA